MMVWTLVLVMVKLLALTKETQKEMSLVVTLDSLMVDWKEHSMVEMSVEKLGRLKVVQWGYL